MSKRNLEKNSLVHIFNRGSKKELIFLGNSDYERFLTKLFEISVETKDKIIQYCLLPNHFHLLIKLFDEQSLPKLMLRLQTSHAKYFCNKYSFIGRVFQRRYKSVKVDSRVQLLSLSRYIHRNPVEFFSSSEILPIYQWSSYHEYIDGKENLIKNSNKEIILGNFRSLTDYASCISSDELTSNLLLKSAEIRKGKVVF